MPPPAHLRPPAVGGVREAPPPPRPLRYGAPAPSSPAGHAGAGLQSPSPPDEERPILPSREGRRGWLPPPWWVVDGWDYTSHPHGPQPASLGIGELGGMGKMGLGSCATPGVWVDWTTHPILLLTLGWVPAMRPMFPSLQPLGSAEPGRMRKMGLCSLGVVGS